MKNLIKMNLYKMIKMKSMYIIFILLTFFITINLVTEKTLMNNEKAKAAIASATSIKSSYANLGVHSNIVFTNDLLSHFKSITDGNLILFFICIFAVLFYLSDIKKGYVKVYAGLYKNKEKIFLSKFITLCIYAFCTVILSLLVTGVLSRLIIGKITINSIKDILSYLFIEIVLIWAVMSMVSLICQLLRNSAISMTITIFITFQFTVLIYMLIEALIDRIFKVDINLLKYSLVNNISRYGIEFSIKDFSFSFCIALVYLAIFLILGTFLSKKQDIC